MKKIKLKEEELSIVKISRDVLLDILKEYLFEHCCEISGVGNKLENVVSSVLFKSEADGISAYLLVANDDDMYGMHRIDFSVDDMAKLDIKEDEPIHYDYNKLKKMLSN